MLILTMSSGFGGEARPKHDESLEFIFRQWQLDRLR